MAEAKPRRITMTSDVAKLRALAADGVSMREAARRTGIAYSNIQRLCGQFNLPFRRAAAYRLADCAMADRARARLEATMRCLRKS
jgi:hypothetical protein